MGSPYQMIAGGSFTSDASSNVYEVQISDEPDLIEIRNRTAWGDDAAETSVQASWRRGMNFDAAQTMDQAVTSGNLSSEAVTANGIRVYNTFNPPTFAALATTAITAADPAVVTMADTGQIQVGDVVRLDNTTGMLQVAGYDFTVDGVNNDTDITLQLDSQNFAAAATAGNVRLIIPGRFYPRWRYIVPLNDAAGITQENECVVTTSVDHDFTIGEKVTFRVSSDYGMTEINNVTGTVLSVGTMGEGAVYTAATTGPFDALRINIDTSGFTAFSFPTSATYAAGATPAVILPAGAGPEVNANPPGVPVDAAFDNRNQWLIRFGSNIITSNSHVYDWVAYKFDRHVAE